jgi:hypothetical protein
MRLVGGFATYLIVCAIAYYGLRFFFIEPNKVDDASYYLGLVLGFMAVGAWSLIKEFLK